MKTRPHRQKIETLNIRQRTVAIHQRREMNEESPKIVPTHHVGSFQAAVQDGMEIGAQAMPSSLLKLRTQSCEVRGG